MPIYVTPEDAKHETKTNAQSEVQTVQKIIEAIQKEDQ